MSPHLNLNPYLIQITIYPLSIPDLQPFWNWHLQNFSGVSQLYPTKDREKVSHLQHIHLTKAWNQFILQRNLHPCCLSISLLMRHHQHSSRTLYLLSTPSRLFPPHYTPTSIISYKVGTCKVP